MIDYYETYYINKYFNISKFINLGLYRVYKVPKILFKKINL